MKRYSLLLAVLLSAILVMAACGSPADPAADTGAAAPAAEEAAEEPAAEEPAEEATEEPAEEPTEEPAEEATEEPAEEPAEEATEEPAEEPTEEPAEEATEEPAEEPAEEATEAPAEETSAEAAEGGGTYVVDTEASTLEWYGERPAGGSESGSVQISGGSMTFDGDQLVDGSFTVDMTTISPTSQTGNMLDMLTNHLLSDEFFGAETYPEASLVLTSAEPTGEENQYLVTGDLTIKETTSPIEFVTDVTVGDGTMQATAEIIVDRAVYDVRYGSGSFFSDLGDDLISDEMWLTVNLVANQAE